MKNKNGLLLSALLFIGIGQLSAQNVGISENNPASMLSVKGNQSVGSGYSTTAAPSNGMIIQGNVGIGIVTPSTKLHVFGDMMVGSGTNSYYSTPAGSGAITLNGSTAGATVRMVMNDGSGTFNQYQNAYYDGTNWRYNAAAQATKFTSSGGTFGLSVAPSGASAGDVISWNTALNIDNSGNVGVNSTNPKSTLDVNGSFGSAVTTLTSGSLTLTSSHSTILASAGTSITLPTCSTTVRRVYTIVYNAASGSPVTIAPNSADNIWSAGASVGTSGSPLSLSSGTITLQSDGNASGKWYVVGSTSASSGSTSGGGPTVGGSTDGLGSSSIVYLSSDATTTSHTLVNVSGLNIALSKSATYEFEAILFVKSSDTKGNDYAINYTGTGTNTLNGLITGQTDWGAAGHTIFKRLTTLNAVSPTSVSASVDNFMDLNGDGAIIMKGILTTGATTSGNIQVKHLKTTSGTATIYAGSYLKVTRIE